MSATGMPSLPCFRINTFCASENFDAFIVFRSSQPGNQTRKTLAKNGPVLWEQIMRSNQQPDSDRPKGCTPGRPGTRTLKWAEESVLYQDSMMETGAPNRADRVT